MTAEQHERLAVALRAAFPTRGEALLREVDRWLAEHQSTRERLKEDADAKLCVLCDRTVEHIVGTVEMRAAAGERPAHFRISRHVEALAEGDTREPITACNYCVVAYGQRAAEFGHDMPAWPTADMVYAEVERALGESEDGTEEIVAELSRECAVGGARPIGEGRCAICAQRRAVILGPRASLCLACAIAAHAKWVELMKILGALRGA